MFGFRAYLFVALVLATTPATSAEDYVLPTGVTVLTEEQLLNQINGNTLKIGHGHNVEYYEPPTGGQKKGRIKGKSAMKGFYEGDWTIKGELMYWHFDKAALSSYNVYYTTALDGDTVTWYKTSGYPYYNRRPPIKLISGNPKNF